MPASLVMHMDICAELSKSLAAIQTLNSPNSITRTIDESERVLIAFASTVTKPLDRIHVCISRLILTTRAFSQTPTQSDIDENLGLWYRSFAVATDIMHIVNDLVKTLHIDLYGSSFFFHGIVLATCTLLRCLKTNFKDGLSPGEEVAAQALFFSAINTLRNLSIAEGDGSARTAWALQNLWRSDTVFRRADGSLELALHSIEESESNLVSDTMWWSRFETRGQSSWCPFKNLQPRKSYTHYCGALIN